MIGRLSKRAMGLTVVPRQELSMLNDYFTKKNMRKQEDEFKKEMEYLANKPNFTLMDYKQRVEDELSKLKSRTLPPTQSSRPNSTRTRRNRRRTLKWRRRS